MTHKMKPSVFTPRLVPRVDSAKSGDAFVGVKILENECSIVFPMGFDCGFADESGAANASIKERNKAVLNLLAVLKQFSQTKDGSLASFNREPLNLESNNFPLSSYMFVIQDFLQNGYYQKNENIHQAAPCGKINWGRTIRTKRPTLDERQNAVYLDFIVSKTKAGDERLVTQIHQFCVHYCFRALGFLYSNYVPPAPKLQFNERLFSSVIKRKAAATFENRRRILFFHLLNVIKDIGQKGGKINHCFGTNSFERVWERLVDSAFGTDDKRDYFPRTTWHVGGKEYANRALVPDTIMRRGESVFILDAKYYRFGTSGNPADLPDSSSIAKQIIYGDFVQRRRANGKSVYNVFVIPYNKKSALFSDGGDSFARYAGFADADWNDGGQPHEKIHAMLVDVKFLLANRARKNDNAIERLAHIIISRGQLP